MKQRPWVLFFVVCLVYSVSTAWAASTSSTVSDGKFLVEESETGRYIVVLKDAPIADYKGGLPGLAATSPKATGTRKLNMNGASAKAYQSYLVGKQDAVLQAAGAAIGRIPTVDFRYSIVLNGFATHISRNEAGQIAGLPGVAFVQPERMDRLLTDAGPEWIGADSVWAGVPGYSAAKGEGVIVGIIDSGINPLNPSFSDPGPVDGHHFTNPLGKFVGVCDPNNPDYDPSFPCNNKLIGAWDFTERIPGNPVGPMDVGGHGTHTASTTAGNLLHVSVPVGTSSLDRTISGVAPHANIIAYRGCLPDALGGCPNSATIAATEQAVRDGVDVINFSIGGGSRAPWRDAGALAFLSARNAGVFVATSAGNSGPDAETIGSPSNAPWVMSVGASTHNRALLNTLHDLTSHGSSLVEMDGQALTSGLEQSPIVLAADFPNPNAPWDEPPEYCCTPYPPGTFSYQIVVCESGECGRVSKSQNVQAGGAAGFVLANGEKGPRSVPSIIADSYVLPGVSLDYENASVLKSWLSASTGCLAAVSGFEVNVNNAWGDVMGYFSSRGPDATSPNVIKPDIAAPGMNILAANGAYGAVSWGVMSGTSMASPHAAGTAALIRQLHPDWTPAQVHSALMMTAQSNLTKENAATKADPFDVGAGRVQVNLAAQAGLILDETYTNYLAADPEKQGDPSTLNIPSLGRNTAVVRHTWKRTVRTAASADTTWTVSAIGDSNLNLEVTPSRFTLGPGQTQEITVTAQLASADETRWLFGRVTFNAAGQTPLHWPVAVRPASSNLESSYSFSNIPANGTVTIKQVQSASEITEFTASVFGMVPAEEYTGDIWQDPTPDQTGDGLTPETGEYVVKKVLKEENARLVAEIFSTTAPDLDLIIWDNTHGVKVCVSAGSTSDEYCNVDNPEAAEYWIIIQCYKASDPTGENPDTFTAGVAVAPNAASANTTVALKPAGVTIPAGNPFDINVAFNLDTQSRRWYGGFVAGSDAENPADIGRTNIDLFLQSPTPATGGGSSGCFIGALW